MSLNKIFSFRKGDRDSVVLIILVIVALVVLFPFIADKKDNTEKTRYGSKGRNGSSLSSGYYAQQGVNDGSVPADENCELFPFNPNTADSTQFLRLGLKKWQIRNIYKYRAHGGRYRCKEDFARLYGLTLEKYRQLEPYITIEKEVMAADVIKSAPRSALYGANTAAHTGSAESAPVQYEGVRKLRHGQTVDINTADTNQLKQIPAIGSYFARRIVELRQRRQMFASPEELLSIRNFPETALEYMTASQNFPKIKVNVMTQKQLAAHPLLNYTQARDIIALRRTTGTLRSVKEMSTLPSFSQQHLQRIAPYLVF